VEMLHLLLLLSRGAFVVTTATFGTKAKQEAFYKGFELQAKN